MHRFPYGIVFVHSPSVQLERSRIQFLLYLRTADKHNRLVFVMNMINLNDYDLPTNLSPYVLPGLLFAVFVLSRKLKLSDEIIGVLSTTSQSLAALFYFFANTAPLFYAGKHTAARTVGQLCCLSQFFFTHRTSYQHTGVVRKHVH